MLQLSEVFQIKYESANINIISLRTDLLTQWQANENLEKFFFIQCLLDKNVLFLPETFNFSIIVLIFLKKWFFVEKTFC